LFKTEVSASYGSIIRHGRDDFYSVIGDYDPQSHQIAGMFIFLKWHVLNFLRWMKFNSKFMMLFILGSFWVSYEKVGGHETAVWKRSLDWSFF